MLLRLTPLPFALLGYALSVTGVKFRPYLGAATGILLYNASLVYFGYAAKHLTGLVQHQLPARFNPHGWMVFGLLALIMLLIYASKRAGRLLKAINLENSTR